MLMQLKKFIPKPIKNIFKLILRNTVGYWEKKILFLFIQRKHQKLLTKLRRKKQIKVVFLAIHKSVWKVDPVFLEMLDDPFFDPVVLVCPYIVDGPERMLGDMRDSLAYFNEKGYPTYSSYVESEQRWMKLEELNPDILFFTNPHNLTIKEYYTNAYLKYLSCYVPYFMLTTTHDGDQSIYNQFFHNCMWKIYMPHEFSMERARLVSATKGKNSELTGYPACEALLRNNVNNLKVWKVQNQVKKKIIFAPHHTIFESELTLSNFISIAEPMRLFAEKYKDEIQWCFKPHPLLKSKLYKHPLWSVEKTHEYYEFWNDQFFTQYEDGEYVDIFLESDAIIHDCGSFIAEYLFMMKPCAYVAINGEAQLNSINEFGRWALNSYVKIKSIDELEGFIVSVKNNAIKTNKYHDDFYDNYIRSMYLKQSPTEKIINNLKFNFQKEI